MDHVRIQTTQNVEIEYPLASVGDRILATLLDFAFFAAYGILISIISSFSGKLETFVAILFSLPVMLYSLLCETFFHGKSFGKMIMKIQVVKLNGTQAGFSDYLLRWLLRLVDILLFFGLIGLLTIIISGKGQRIGDIAAATTVVKLKHKTHMDDTILRKITTDYHLVFKEVSRLTDHDISIIKEVLTFSIKNNKQEAILKLAEKTKQTAGIVSDMPAQKFLETIIQDYNHFHFEK